MPLNLSIGPEIRIYNGVTCFEGSRWSRASSEEIKRTYRIIFLAHFRKWNHDVLGMKSARFSGLKAISASSTVQGLSVKLSLVDVK